MAVTTAAVIGIATGAASAIQGFTNASKQARLAEEANKAAAEAIADAKSKASVDYYESLAVPLDAYESEFEANLQGQTQTIEALQEGDQRALAGSVGQIGAKQQARNEATRIDMAEDIFALDKLKVENKDAINQQLIEMDVSAAKEQNQRMRDAQIARADSMQQGFDGLSQAATSGADLAPLYGNKGPSLSSKGTQESLISDQGSWWDEMYGGKVKPSGKYNFTK